MAPDLPATAVLLIIDVQNAIDHPRWGVRNNAQAEVNIARLLTHWRDHVRHDSREAQSPYRPGQAGNDFKPEVAPREGEVVIVKHTNSAFIGTDLQARLLAGGHDTLVVAGVITNNSVE